MSRGAVPSVGRAAVPSMSRGAVLATVGWGAALILLALLPLAVSAYGMAFAMEVLSAVALAGSWNLFSGMTGYFSLGHGLFFGVGAYAFAVLTTSGALGPWPSVAAGGLLAAAWAVLLSFVMLRVRVGVAYFAVMVLGMNEIVRIAVMNSQALGSTYGITLAPMPDPALAYYAMLVLAAAVVGLTQFLSTRPAGLALRAIAADEVAAEASGVPTFRYKAGAFVLSSLFPGLAGAVTAWYWSYVDPMTAFDLVRSFDMVVMTVFGGTGSVAGPVLGAVVMSVLQEWFSTTLPYLHTLVFGALVVVLIVKRPGGIVEILRRGPVPARAAAPGAGESLARGGRP